MEAPPPAAKVAPSSALARPRPAKARSPPTLTMVMEAVRALNERKGASAVAIRRYILHTYPAVDPIRLKYYLKGALAKGLEKGQLVRPPNSSAQGATGRFKLGAEKAKPGRGKKKEAALEGETEPREEQEEEEEEGKEGAQKKKKKTDKKAKAKAPAEKKARKPKAKLAAGEKKKQKKKPLPPPSPPPPPPRAGGPEGEEKKKKPPGKDPKADAGKGLAPAGVKPPGPTGPQGKTVLPKAKGSQGQGLPHKAGPKAEATAKQAATKGKGKADPGGASPSCPSCPPSGEGQGGHRRRRGGSQ
ncbi:hypothetical protein JRQ81_008665 [Phrynocephalus forsythii]|uniref:H15 domain-containing protein n=1 Tax=Phrynocephalus forsythii TaxID=171643 RepID=A0A9Q1ASN1_9SAUR|nr:hypothetical protein JRQ81_008665 [Phrynocephalus forsythii]